MTFQILDSINMQGGLDVSLQPFSPASSNVMTGGWNTIITGSGHVRTWAGLGNIFDGSHKMFPFGNTWGGIKRNAGVAVGSFFQDIGKSRWGIGAGFPHIQGTSVTSWTLSTNLQLSVASSGVYATPVTAGLAQPSAPEVGIVPASVGTVSGPVSVKIERSRPSTGARSVASPTSAVIAPAANRIRVTFPAAATGQTHWRVYLTFQGFGGTGIHYLAPFSTLTNIPESTVASSTVDGISRSLEFNYKDGDLIPLEASFDDYPPPAATHALRLQNVLNLIGCYSDSVASPTASSPGTAIAVSKENNYESYVPTSLLFLPEQVVDCLARPIDDYGYIACENSIHALQYVGNRGDELPSCTLTTILPDIGIQYAHNWCHFRGRLLLYTAAGNLIMMDETGNFDTSFAGPVAKILATFTTAATAVGYDPQTDSIVVFNGVRMLVYSLQAQQWRQIWGPDFGITDSIVACTTARRTLYVGLESGASVYTSEYDRALGVYPRHTSFISSYRQGLPGTVSDIYEAAVAMSGAAARVFLVIGTNLSKMEFRRISVTTSSVIATDADSGFTSDITGKRAVIFGQNIGGSGVHYKVATLTSSGASQAIMDSISQATASNCLMLVGKFIESKVVAGGVRGGHATNFFPHLAEARSYQVGVVIMTPATPESNVLSVELLGNLYSSSRAL